MTDREAGRRVARKLLLVNAGLVVGAFGVYLLVLALFFDINEFEVRRAVALALAVAVSLQVLALLWRGEVRRWPDLWRRRTRHERAGWYFRVITLGSACAFLSGLLVAVVAAVWDVLFERQYTVFEVLFGLLFAPLIGLGGVVFGFLFLVIPVLSPLVVLSWERALKHDTPGFPNANNF